ncbi:hypothetical protein WN51_10828 [Melipona quadrifasciata]|uniref:Uncharacterized protein n=1 Tax=Melipona quadrifasciata TaxID=166423 RepID=A0A0N0BI33_9HYME|nr:hypothetical protein WN51_10828 [Melipona quadrifasciata]
MSLMISGSDVSLEETGDTGPESICSVGTTTESAEPSSVCCPVSSEVSTLSEEISSLGIVTFSSSTVDFSSISFAGAAASVSASALASTAASTLVSASTSASASVSASASTSALASTSPSVSQLSSSCDFCTFEPAASDTSVFSSDSVSSVCSISSCFVSTLSLSLFSTGDGCETIVSSCDFRSEGSSSFFSCTSCATTNESGLEPSILCTSL